MGACQIIIKLVVKTGNYRRPFFEESEKMAKKPDRLNKMTL